MALKKLIPKSVIEKMDAEHYGIVELVKFASKKISDNSILVDAGAGECLYKVFFPNANYVAVDFVLPKRKNSKLDVIADLTFLPFRDDSVDAILNTQVLEHIKKPEKALSEFYRVLKNEGKLFLTAPQGWGIHYAPHDYFRFTSYALEYLFKSVGFKIVFIKPRGGYFWYLGNALRQSMAFIKNRILRIFLLPFLRGVIPYLCFYLDGLDENKTWTLGYACFCKKLD